MFGLRIGRLGAVARAVRELFSPAKLFAASEPGVWYDPSDIERYTSQLGPELVTNGDFSNGTTGWTGAGTSPAALTVVSGELVQTSTAVGNPSFNGAEQIITTTAGKWYTVTGFIRNGTSTDVRLRAVNGTYSGTVLAESAIVTATVATQVRLMFLATSTTTSIYLRTATTGPGQLSYFDNISVKELTAIDTATMFQDAAGTTPVTAVEQPVGLILDKSKGLVRGPELVTNGTFDTNVNGWTVVQATFVWNSGTGVITTTVGEGYVTQLISGLVVGRTYAFEFFASGGTARVVIGPTIGNNSVYNGPYGTSGLITGKFVASAASLYFSVKSASAVGIAVTLDSISVRELPGNHATQTTSTSRPVLSARYNLLTKTEQFDDAAWTKSNVTAMSATVLQETTPTGVHGLSRTFTYNAAVYALTARVKAGSGSRNIALRLWDGTTSYGAIFNPSTGAFVGNGPDAAPTSYSTQDLGGGTFQLSMTAAVAAGTGNVTIYLAAGTTLTYAGSTSNTIEVQTVSLVPANQASLPYQRVNTSTDYDADPSKFKPYLRFDGVDDWLVTPTITPGTDKAQVFAGVRKLSDAAVGMVVESSVSSFSNIGSLSIRAPQTAGSTYGFVSGGSFPGILAQSPTSYAAPITNILTGTGDISGDSAILRINGAQAASSTADQGTGNYLAYPIYIGHRGGTTLPFNGNLYGLIVRFGSNLPAATIASTENWVAGKTGITL